MLQGNRSQSERSVGLSQARPSLVARLRLFGMLAVLGPLFAGLHSLALEGVPQVEVRFVAAESSVAAPDPVVVEKVVERLVYVPVDNLSAPALTEVPALSGELSRRATADTAVAEPTAGANPEAVASEPEAESPAVAPVVVRRAPVAPVVGVAEPEAAEDAVAEEAPAADAAAEDGGDLEEVAEADTESAPRVIVVHTMVWDGEQFVEPADGSGEMTVILDTPDQADSESDAGQQAAESGAEPVPAAEASDEPMSVGEDDSEPQQLAAAEDEPEQVAEAPDEAEQITKIDESMAASESDGEPEQVAVDESAPEQASEASDEPEQVADVDESMSAIEVEGEPEQVAEAADLDQATEAVDPDQTTEAVEPEQIAEAGDDSEMAAETEGQLEQVVEADDDSAPLTEAGAEPEDEPEASDESAEDEAAARASLRVVDTVYTPTSSD